MFQTVFATVWTFVGNKSDKFYFGFTFEPWYDFFQNPFDFPFCLILFLRETLCLSTKNGVRHPASVIVCKLRGIACDEVDLWSILRQCRKIWSTPAPYEAHLRCWNDTFFTLCYSTGLHIIFQHPFLQKMPVSDLSLSLPDTSWFPENLILFSTDPCKCKTGKSSVMLKNSRILQSIEKMQ